MSEKFVSKPVDRKRVGNTAKQRAIAAIFNSELNRLAKKLGKKPKLQSMQVSQTVVLNNIEKSYRKPRKRGERPIKTTVLRGYVEIGETSAENEYLQAYDPLTGCLSERGAQRAIIQRIAKMNRAVHREGFGIIVIDIKNFKYLNDGLGHSGGDKVLKKITEIMKGESRVVDDVWRIAGDEFAVMMDTANQKQFSRLVFHERHNGRLVKPGWVKEVNVRTRKWLSNYVNSSQVKFPKGLGDAGELRAGVLFFNKDAFSGVEGDYVSHVIKAVKKTLEEIKHTQHSMKLDFPKES